MRSVGVVRTMIIVALAAVTASAADWEIRLVDDVTVEISYQQVPVVTSFYVCWGTNWKWTDIDLTLADTAGLPKRFTGDAISTDQPPSMDLIVDGTVSSPSSNQLRFSWDFIADQDLTDVIGGGLQFGVAVDTSAFGAPPPDPVLRPDNHGWDWEPIAGQTLSVAFDDPLGASQFPTGTTDVIRSLFFTASFPTGTQTYTMTVTLPPGGVVAQSVEERYGPEDTENWFVEALPLETSPVDVSWLNHKPAGKHGFVQAQGDQFVFADGTPARSMSRAWRPCRRGTRR